MRKPWRRRLRQHWYVFVFQGDNADSGRTCMASTYTGYLTRGITLPRIAENKEHAGVDSGAVLLSVSYLGHMTRDSFSGDQKESD